MKWRVVRVVIAVEWGEQADFHFRQSDRPQSGVHAGIAFYRIVKLAGRSSPTRVPDNRPGAGHSWTSGGQSATFEYCHIWLALVFRWSLLHLFMYYNLLKVWLTYITMAYMASEGPGHLVVLRHVNIYCWCFGELKLCCNIVGLGWISSKS